MNQKLRYRHATPGESEVLRFGAWAGGAIVLLFQLSWRHA